MVSMCWSGNKAILTADGMTSRCHLSMSWPLASAMCAIGVMGVRDCCRRCCIWLLFFLGLRCVGLCDASAAGMRMLQGLCLGESREPAPASRQRASS